MILITLNGESLLVESLDGYDGCTVVEKDVDLPPNDHCSRVDGQWVEDTAAKEAADQAAALAAMSRAEFAAMIDAKIAEQAARVDSLAVAVAVDPATLATGTDTVSVGGGG